MQNKYNVDKHIIDHDLVCIKTCKCIAGLKQATLLTYKCLRNSLEPCGFTLTLGIISTWQHNSRLIKFYLCTDNFRVNYSSKSNLDHLCNAVKNYKYTINIEE